MSRRVHHKEGRSTNILLNRFIMCGERWERIFGHSDQGKEGGRVRKEGGRDGGREGGREEKDMYWKAHTVCTCTCM